MTVPQEQTPDDQAALAEATRVVNAANAIIRTMKSDDVVTLARGLVCAAAVMAGMDQTARTQVGIEMMRTAIGLDPHLMQVTWQ